MNGWPVMAAYCEAYSSGPSANALNLQRSRLSENASTSWRILVSSPLPFQASGSVFGSIRPSSLAGV